MPTQNLPADPRAVFGVGALVVAVRRLASGLDDVARRLHAAESLTVAERNLLLALRQGGPQTIPQLASRRGASRQYVQQALAPLAARGLVAWRDNPRHRRSRLADLTDEGAALARRVMEREGELLRALAAGEEPAPLLAAVESLRRLEAALAVAATDGPPARPRAAAAEG